MTATYNPGKIDPAAGEYISAVRWLLQDIDTAVAEVVDDELTAIFVSHDTALSQEVRVYRTAAALAQALHRRYAKQATFRSGSTEVELGERARYWAVIASELTAKAVLFESGGSALVIYASRDTSF